MDYAGAFKHWKNSGKPALMSVFHNQGQFDKSNVWFDDGEIRVYNKFAPLPQMQFIDHGLGILRADLLRAFPADQAFDLAAVYQDLAERGQLAGYEVQERFYEVGSHEGISDLNQLLTPRASGTSPTPISPIL